MKLNMTEVNSSELMKVDGGRFPWKALSCALGTVGGALVGAAAGAAVSGGTATFLGAGLGIGAARAVFC